MRSIGMPAKTEYPEWRVAARDQFGLQRAGRGVEPGVQDRGVRLAGALADISARFQEGHTELIAGQLTGDGAADHTAPDHGHVYLDHGGGAAGATTFSRRAQAHSDPAGKGRVGNDAVQVGQVTDPVRGGPVELAAVGQDEHPLRVRDDDPLGRHLIPVVVGQARRGADRARPQEGDVRVQITEEAGGLGAGAGQIAGPDPASGHEHLDVRAGGQLGRDQQGGRGDRGPQVVRQGPGHLEAGGAHVDHDGLAGDDQGRRRRADGPLGLGRVPGPARCRRTLRRPAGPARPPRRAPAAACPGAPARSGRGARSRATRRARRRTRRW